MKYKLVIANHLLKPSYKALLNKCLIIVDSTVKTIKECLAFIYKNFEFAFES